MGQIELQSIDTIELLTEVMDEIGFVPIGPRVAGDRHVMGVRSMKFRPLGTLPVALIPKIGATVAFRLEGNFRYVINGGDLVFIRSKDDAH